MHRSPRLLATLAATLLLTAGLVAAGTTATAHDDHGGTWDPSPESSSQNLKVLGSAPRTSDVPSYRNSDLAFWGKTASPATTTASGPSTSATRRTRR
jgi:hypothetical protein